MEIKQCLAFYENTNYRQLSGVLFTNSTGRPNGKWELARDLSGGNYSPCYEIFVFFFFPLFPFSPVLLTLFLISHY